MRWERTIDRKTRPKKAELNLERVAGVGGRAKDTGQREKLQVLATATTSLRSPATPFLTRSFQDSPVPPHTGSGTSGRGSITRTALDFSCTLPPCTPLVTVPIFVSLQSLSHAETMEEGNHWEIQEGTSPPPIHDLQFLAPRTQAFKRGSPGKLFDRVAVLWSPPPLSVSAPRAAGFKCALARALALLPGSAARLEPQR